MTTDRVSIAPGWSAVLTRDAAYWEESRPLHGWPVYFQDGRADGMDLPTAVRAGVLAAVRKARRQTQREVADLLGVSRVTEARWECGLLSPALSRRGELTNYLVPIFAQEEFQSRLEMEWGDPADWTWGYASETKQLVERFGMTPRQAEEFLDRSIADTERACRLLGAVLGGEFAQKTREVLEALERIKREAGRE